MEAKIEKYYQRLFQEHEYSDRLLAELDKQQLEFRARNDKWNIEEILYHIYLSESGILRFMQNFSFERKNELLGFSSKYRSFLMNVFLQTPVKFKAPTRYLEQFPEVIQPAELRKDNQEVYAQMKSFLEEFDQSKLPYFIFKHPVVGKMNLSQTLGFMYRHKVHHRKQIENLLNHKNFPKLVDVG